MSMKRNELDLYFLLVYQVVQSEIYKNTIYYLN